MTTMERSVTAAEIATPKRQLGTISWKWMVTTDHKKIGNLYFITTMAFFKTRCRRPFGVWRMTCEARPSRSRQCRSR